MFNKNSLNYNTKKIIIILFAILLIFFIFHNILFKKDKETFKNQIVDKKYIKLSDTHIKNNNKKWNELTLKQCQMKCNEDDKCIGFSRDNIDDNVKGSCYPKENYNKCYSLRKGDPEQRREAINYNTYIKQHYYNDNQNILNKCLGDESTTLNRDVFIYSYSKPDNYITLSNNQIHSKQFTLKDIEFHRSSKFKIVKGLEGSGTVSFIKVDNNNENYYLSNNDTGYLELIPIDEKNSKSLERGNASFELLDGFSDKSKFTIRTFSLVNLNLYLILDGNKKNPRIKLVKREMIDNKNKKEAATFDIVNHITNDSFIDTKEDFQSHNPRKYPYTLRKKHLDTFQDTGEDLDDFSSSIDSIVLVDIDNNKLMLPVLERDMVISENKLDYLIKKFNNNVIKDEMSDEIEIGDLVIPLTESTNYPTTIYKFTYNPNTKYIEEGSNDEKITLNPYELINKKYTDKKNSENGNYKDYKVFKKKKEYTEKRDSTTITLDFIESGFKKDNIQTIIITNPKHYSVRIYNYDLTRPNVTETKKQQNVFNKVNHINDESRKIRRVDNYTYQELKLLSHKYNIYRDNKTKNEIYNDYLVVEAINNGINEIDGYELLKKKDDDNLFTNIINPVLARKPDSLEKLRNEINDSHFFKIKSLKIFKFNPKEKFLKNKNPLNDSFNQKMEKIYTTYKDKNKNLSDINYNKKKEKELEEYRDTINNYKNKLETLSSNLDLKAKKVFNKANGYKLNKLAEDYFMLANTKKSQINLQ
jgi:hypothetical protein